MFYPTLAASECDNDGLVPDAKTKERNPQQNYRSCGLKRHHHPKLDHVEVTDPRLDPARPIDARETIPHQNEARILEHPTNKQNN